MRLLATDLDGTLLGTDGAISARSVAALHAAREHGWYVVLATGRPPFMVDLLMPELSGAVTHGVLANGSVVCTLPDQRVLHTIQFDLDSARHAVEVLRRHDAGYGFALATDAGFAHQPGFAERMPAPQIIAPSVDAMEAAEGATVAIKLMAFHDRYSAHELLALLPTLLDEHLSITHVGADCVEIGPVGVDKGAGLSWLCGELGVDAADVVAFGDEFNDHQMLRWAGHSVAMANAHPATRALADEIAASNLDDGVAAVVERMIAAERPY
jgi:Cof subfamily protein (haloacid dehalogenase superfamily)